MLSKTSIPKPRQKPIPKPRKSLTGKFLNEVLTIILPNKTISKQVM